MHGYALANMVAMILLLQQKTHLWYHLFAIEELEGSFMTGYMVCDSYHIIVVILFSYISMIQM